jgi:hypothetical protein
LQKYVNFLNRSSTLGIDDEPEEQESMVVSGEDSDVDMVQEIYKRKYLHE